MKFMTKIFSVVLLAAAAASANASVIGVWNDTDIDSYSLIHRGDVTCTSCSVLQYTSGYSFSNSYGELFTGPSSSGDANEALWVNSVLGTSYTGTDVTNGKTDLALGPNTYTFSGTALYVLLKIGKNPDYTIVRNDSGNPFSFTWTGIEGTGSGLSHFVTLGGTPVPEPGVLSLFLLGFVSLGVVRKLKK